MMKSIRKWSVILLSLVMVVSMAAPALAVSANEYAVLNVRYAPDDKIVDEEIQITAYQVATVTGEEGSYSYTPTEAFEGLGLDLNKLLQGEGVNSIPTGVYKQLRSGIGEYINANADMGSAVGTTVNTGEDGIAQFTGLKDGLYLISTRYSVWINSTQYVPIAFLISIPYYYNDMTNNYITATLKFTENTPTGGGSTGPAPSPSVDIDEEDVPLGEPDVPDVDEEEPTIDILPEDVPLTDLPDLPEDPDSPDNPYNPDIEIPDDDVPLSKLPQTGLLWWPVPLMAAAGLALVIFGITSNKKAGRNA